MVLVAFVIDARVISEKVNLRVFPKLEGFCFTWTRLLSKEINVNSRAGDTKMRRYDQYHSVGTRHGVKEMQIVATA